VAGLGQALDQLSDAMPFIQGRNEQALVHAATAFAKHSRRQRHPGRDLLDRPGALNMVTGAALATVNRLPVLLLPGQRTRPGTRARCCSSCSTPWRRMSPSTTRSGRSAASSTAITRPEQLLTALPAAMRVLTDPADTGAVVLSLPQDIQSHATTIRRIFLPNGPGSSPPAARR